MTPCTFTYLVTNTGNTTLNNVTVIDSTLGPVICPKATLEPGETMNCGPETEVVVTAGPMYMQATVTGNDPNGTPVTDTDPVNFIVVVPANPAIDIEKAVNGYDADNPPGPIVYVGDDVTFTYVVTNTGNTVLNNIQVVDDHLGPIACPSTSLNPGETMNCDSVTKTTTMTGPMGMESTVTGYDPNGTPVTDTDPVNFYVKKRHTKPAIDIENYVNVLDADDPPGAIVYVGDDVTFDYVVTNTGDTVVNNILVVDDYFGPIVCPSTSLNPGESMNCQTLTVTATADNIGQFLLVATVTGNDPNGTPVTDSDPINVCVKWPGEH